MLESPTTSLALALALALLVGPLAGCLSGDPGSAGSTSTSEGNGYVDMGVEIPYPAEGSWYNYTSTSRQAAHNVTVGSVENRTDAWLRERPARLLEITHYSGYFEAWYTLESAVDPWTGLLVSQWADCGTPRSNQEDGCMDDRVNWYAGSQGLPGGFGAAPFWGQALEPRTVNRSLPTVLGPLDTWNVQLTTPSFSEASTRECLEVEPVQPHPTGWVLAFRFSGGLRSFTLCEGVAMPVEYDDHNGNTYRLQDHDTRPGQAPSEPRPELSPWPPPPVPLVERTPPLLAEAPELDPALPLQEAHEAALERSEPYAALFDSAADAGVFETVYLPTGRGDGGILPTSSNQWSHTMQAIDEHGRLVEVEIEKNEKETAGRNETTYEVLEEKIGSVDDPVPQVDAWTGPQANVVAAIDLGEELTQRPQQEKLQYRKVHRLIPDAWTPTEWPNRLEGPSLQVFFEVGGPCGGDEGNGASLGVYCPYHMVVDGPTGAIHHLTGPPDALNENLR